MPSPICLINNTSVSNGFDATSGQSLTLKLANYTGVNSWDLKCIGTDEDNSTAEINSSLTYNKYKKIYYLTLPSNPGAFIFKSIINNGKDNSGILRESYTNTFGVFIKYDSGYRPVAVNQVYEGNSNFGWIVDINEIREDFNADNTYDITDVSYIPDVINVITDMSAGNLVTTDGYLLNNIHGGITFQTRIFDSGTDGYCDVDQKDRFIFCITDVDFYQVHLPAPTEGRILTITNNSAYTDGYVRIIPYASEDIPIITIVSKSYFEDGYLPGYEFTLFKYQSCTLVSDGTDWFLTHYPYVYAPPTPEPPTPPTPEPPTPVPYVINVSVLGTGYNTMHLTVSCWSSGDVTIDWGDNTTTEWTNPNPSTTSYSFYHEYTAVGNYQISITSSSPSAGQGIYGIITQHEFPYLLDALIFGNLPQITATNLYLYELNAPIYSFSMFSGTLPILEDTDLHIFRARNNNLSGTIDISNLTDTLTEFNIGMDGNNTTSISGTIPSLDSLTGLQKFYANNSQISGYTSSTLSTDLYYFDLRSCNLDETSVDNILVDFATNIASRPSNGSILLANGAIGTNAAPSATGLAAKAAILAEKPSWTITHA